jgi:hypothetical protein
MLGHVVLRYAEPLRNLADVKRLVEQQADNADPGVLAEGSERDDAVVSLNDGKRTVAGRKTVELNGLIDLAGCGHGGRNTSSHNPWSEASREERMTRPERLARKARAERRD